MNTVAHVTNSYMQTEIDSEEDPLFHELPLNILITWTALAALDRQSAYASPQEKVFGVVGPYLRGKRTRVDNRIVHLRTDWSARGRELNRLDKIKRSVV